MSTDSEFVALVRISPQRAGHHTTNHPSDLLLNRYVDFTGMMGGIEEIKRILAEEFADLWGYTNPTSPIYVTIYREDTENGDTLIKAGEFTFTVCQRWVATENG